MKPVDPRLLRRARASRRHLVVCVVLGVVDTGLILAQAELLARGVARVVAHGTALHGIGWVLVGLGLVVLGRAWVAWLVEVAARRASAGTKSELRRQLVARVARPGPCGLGGTRRAEAATLAIEGLDALDPYFGRYLPQLVLAAIVPVAVITRLAFADLTSAAIVAVTLPLIPVFMVLIGWATESAVARRWQAMGRLSHHFLDVVSGLPTLKVFGRARAQAASVRRVTEEYRSTTMATLRLAFASSLVLELLAMLSVALVAVSVGLRLVDGRVGLGVGLLAIVLAPEAYAPLREVGARFHAAADGAAAADRVFELLDEPAGAHGPGGTVHGATGRPAFPARRPGVRVPVPDLGSDFRLAVAGLRIAHPGRDGFAPDGVDLEVRRGEVVAVVGPSGAGKTSLLGAVLGIVPVSAGRVTVRGAGTPVDVADLDQDAWRQSLAWVDQSPYLFSGTVAANVRLAAPGATDDEIREALAAAGLTTLSPDREVGESGRALSAGERRRVAMARAVLRAAPLVLLDEPTAGLDHRSEVAVVAAIRRLAAQSAVLLVSHRPLAIGAADRVVHLQGGRVDDRHDRASTGRTAGAPAAGELVTGGP